jgi:uncharacterized protein
MFRTSKKIILSLLLLPVFVFAYASPGRPAGFVNDFAGILNATERQNLETELVDFKKQTGAELAVVTVKNLGGDTVENYAVELFKDWGIGEKGKDNGVLLLVALEDRKMRIEVGYGLEGVLTDAQASSIIRNTLTPAFRGNDYGGGITGAVNQIITIVKPEYASSEGIASEIQSSSSSKSNGFNIEHIFFLLFFVPVWLASILGRSKSWWAGGVVGGV